MFDSGRLLQDLKSSSLEYAGAVAAYCLGLTPRDGVMIAAFTTAFTSIVNLMIGVIALVEMSSERDKEIKQDLASYGYSSLAASFILFLLFVLLLMALEQEAPHYVIPWLIIHAIDIIFGTEIIFNKIVMQGFGHVIHLFIIIFEIYIWVLVFKFYREASQEEGEGDR